MNTYCGYIKVNNFNWYQVKTPVIYYLFISKIVINFTKSNNIVKRMSEHNFFQSLTQARHNKFYIHNNVYIHNNL